MFIYRISPTHSDPDRLARRIEKLFIASPATYFSGGLDMVSRMNVKKYEFISAPGNERVGFIAQELQTVYPQAVSGDPDGDVEKEPMGVDYGRVTPVLVSAIQELLAKNKALEQRLARLEAQLNNTQP